MILTTASDISRGTTILSIVFGTRRASEAHAGKSRSKDSREIRDEMWKKYVAHIKAFVQVQVSKPKRNVQDIRQECVRSHFHELS